MSESWVLTGLKRGANLAKWLRPHQSAQWEGSPLGRAPPQRPSLPLLSPGWDPHWDHLPLGSAARSDLLLCSTGRIFSSILLNYSCEVWKSERQLYAEKRLANSVVGNITKRTVLFVGIPLGSKRVADPVIIQPYPRRPRSAPFSAHPPTHQHPFVGSLNHTSLLAAQTSLCSISGRATCPVGGTIVRQWQAKSFQVGGCEAVRGPFVWKYTLSLSPWIRRRGRERYLQRETFQLSHSPMLQNTADVWEKVTDIGYARNWIWVTNVIVFSPQPTTGGVSQARQRRTNMASIREAVNTSRAAHYRPSQLLCHRRSGCVTSWRQNLKRGLLYHTERGLCIKDVHETGKADSGVWPTVGPTNLICITSPTTWTTTLLMLLQM